jgi:hypothetical protein
MNMMMGWNVSVDLPLSVPSTPRVAVFRSLENPKGVGELDWYLDMALCSWLLASGASLALRVKACSCRA